MFNIIKSTFRNKKLNLIYIGLIMIIIVIVACFQTVKEYFDYTINYVYGSLEENRMFTVLNPSAEFLDTIKEEFMISAIMESTSYMDEESYNIVISNYSDKESFINYLKEHNISYYQDNFALTDSINAAQKSIDYFNTLELISMVILFCIMYYILENIYDSDTKNISILKVMGYKNRDNLKIIFLRVLALILISTFLTIILFLIGKLSFIFITNKNIKDFIIYLNIFKVIFPAFIFTILVLIAKFLPYMFKIRKIDVFASLNE